MQQHSKPITDFFRITNGSDPEARELQMGALAQVGIDPEQFSILCMGFAEGVAYVEDKFKTVPRGLVITDEDALTPRYNVDSQTIHIPQKFIFNLIRNIYTRQGKTGSLDLSSYQAAKMYGVEEAFHHHQFTRNPDCYAALLNRQTATPAGLAYNEEPIEKEAKAVVQQAMQDFGFTGVRVGGATFVLERDTLERLRFTQRLAEDASPQHGMAV